MKTSSIFASPFISRRLDARSRLTRAWLLAGAVAGCLTGDSLVGRFCRSDEDCDVVASPRAQRLMCINQACGLPGVGWGCGDGIVVSGEDCDDGNRTNNDACPNTCQMHRCGDGILSPSEECDDGNAVNDDECSNDCTSVECGDGIVQADSEECDDGNRDANDACVDCRHAFCGDGAVREDVDGEECDDGNGEDDDACTSACKKAVCGDGIVQQMVEMCDDGDSDDGDGCTRPECRMAATALSRSVGAHEAHHTCAIRLGAVRCWGPNEVYQLGDATASFKGDELSDSPFLDVDLGGAKAVEVAIGVLHTCVLTDAGAVKCWGTNLTGGLGIPGEQAVGDEPGEFPLADLALPGDVAEAEGSQLAAAEKHTCAVLAGGGVVCWGTGPLGYQGIASVHDPASVGPVPIGKAVKEIGAGTDHTCALTVDGEVFCWGDAQLGALGYGNFEDIGDDEDPSAAGPVDLGGRRAERLFVGHRSTCVLSREDPQSPRRLRCWGNNSCGKLGYWHGKDLGNDEPPPDIPVRVLEAEADVVEVGLGVVQTCAVLADGAVRCWGSDLSLAICSAGDIGDDPGEMAKTIELEGPARQIHVGAAHVCALSDRGDVYCWGRNLEGQLGVGRLGLQTKICPAAIYDISATLDCQRG